MRYLISIGLMALVAIFITMGCSGETNSSAKGNNLPTMQPTSTNDGDVVEFSALTEKPVAKKTANPQYPESAREAGIEGRVILSGIVEKDGSVSHISVVKSSGNSEMDDAAIAAFQQFQFEPGKVDGTPVRSKIIVPFQFKLNTK